MLFLCFVPYTEHKLENRTMSGPAIHLITDKGKKKLGNLLRGCRENLGLSMDDLMVLIATNTGYTLSKSAISDLENGKTDPKWNTLAIVSAAGYVQNPSTGKPFTPSEMFQIACESNDADVASTRKRKSKLDSALEKTHHDLACFQYV